MKEGRRGKGGGQGAEESGWTMAMKDGGDSTWRQGAAKVEKSTEKGPTPK